jgi:RNA polymerase sigma-70 factor, ECF subfamily
MATATALQMSPQEPILVDGYQRNIEELTNVITRHSPRFRRIAMGHLGSIADAEDAVQDALLAALTHVQQFKGQAQMSTWVTSIVINSSRMKLRKRSASIQLSLDESRDDDFPLAELIPDTRPGPEAQYRKLEITEMLSDAISRLSPILRKTFELRDVRGLTVREAAHAMGVPSGTVKARLARARVKIRKAIMNPCRKKSRCEVHSLAGLLREDPSTLASAESAEVS